MALRRGDLDHAAMPPELRAVFAGQGGVATAAQILRHLTRRGMQRQVRTGALVRVWPDIYSVGAPDRRTALCGLDLRCGDPSRSA